MRQPTDDCLLCRINKSTKKNSHILPRFISTKFLGAKGAGRVGYSLDDKTKVSIDENGEVTSKATKIQDSPKEDHILCEECEAYFSILETDSAPLYNFWDKKVANGEYKRLHLNPHFNVVLCVSANQLINRLFVYSMFWRASISSHDLFEGYNLNANFEESLRVALLSYKGNTKGEVLNNINQLPVPIYPYSMLTADSFKDETANVLAALNSGNPASLHVDRFGFFLFECVGDLKDILNRDFANRDNQNLYLMILSQQLWSDVVVGRAIQMFAEEKIRDMKKGLE